MTTARPFLKMSEVFLVLMFLITGAMVPAAYGSIAKPPAPTVSTESIAERDSQAACRMLLSVKGVSECHVMDFTAFDVIVPGSHINTASVFCDWAAGAISESFPSLSGKTYKVRVFASGDMLTTAKCRVPYNAG